MNYMNALIILLITLIILFLLSFYLSGNDIMAPSVVMSIMFILSTVFAILNIRKWNLEYSFISVAIISSGVFVFIISEVSFRIIFCGQLRGKFTVNEYHDVKRYDVKEWILNFLIIYDIVVCLWFLKTIIDTVGGNMLSLSSYFLAYRRMGIASLKYQQGASITTGIVNQCLKIVTASGHVASYIFINNMFSGGMKKITKYKYIFLMILSIVPTIMTGGRTGILKMESTILIEYYIIWHQKNGWTKNLSGRYVRIGLLSLLIAIPLFYYSLSLFGRTTEQSMINYVSIYLGSSITNFDQYLKEPIECNFFGEESLVGIRKILSFLGLGSASSSYNLEFRSFGELSSNVYTFFRRPLHDFGLFGMYFFTACVSLFFSWLYYYKIKYRRKSKTDSWVIVYGYFYYWIISSSILQYSTNLISAGTVIILFLIIGLFKIITRNRELNE